jgi:hypothetical protein
MNEVAGGGSQVAADDSATRDLPPATSNWRLLYSIVLAELAVTIAIFYAFTRAFR